MAEATVQLARFEAVTSRIGAEDILHALDLVDSPPEEVFDVFTRLASRALSVPIALISFVEENRDRQYFKSIKGLTGIFAEARETPLSHSFCQHVKRDNRPLIVEDAPADSRVCGNLATSELGVIAYLGVPICGPDGMALGALCSIDTSPRRWETADVETMRDLALVLSEQIRLRWRLLYR